MRTSLHILLCVMAVLASSCYKAYDSRVNVGEGVRSDSLDYNIVTRPIGTAFSILIGEGIDIKDIKTWTNKSGFMELQVSGYNRATSKRRFEYKVEWLDSNNVVIGTQTSTWLPVSAMAKSAFSFKAVAPSRAAVDFKMNTRKAN